MSAEPIDWAAALEGAIDTARRVRLETEARDAEDHERQLAEWREQPDLTVGNVALTVNDRVRRCGYCDRAILPGAGVVAHTPLPHVSVVRDHYHPECVDIP
jgi:hypothetical protein